MHIAFVIQHYPPFIAGAERQVALLAALVGEKVGRCDVITTRFRRDLPKRAREGNVTVRRLPTLKPRTLKFGINLLMGFFYLLVHAPRYSHIHVSNLSPFSAGAVIAIKIWRRPVLLKIGALGADGEIAKVLRHPLGGILWRVFRSADKFIAPTPVARQELLDRGVPAERIVLIPNAIATSWSESPSPEAREALRRDLRLPEGPVVLFAGRLAPAKGVRLLLEAWFRAAAETPATLLIVGDGPEREWIESRLRGHGLGHTVRLLGWQTDPRPFFQAADIFAFASESETFGNVLAEAMASGLAIISTPVGLAAAWLVHGRNGLLSGHDADEFTVHLLRLLNDRELRETMGATARRDAETRFAPELVLQKYLSLCGSPQADTKLHATQTD